MTTVERKGRQVVLPNDRQVQLFVCNDNTLAFYFINGEAEYPLRISREAFGAMLQLVAAMEDDGTLV